MDLEMLVRMPDHRPVRQPPLLFVHGAWHAAWCWEEHFLPFFAGAGYACYAPSLRGHGASPGREQLRGTSLRDYVDDIAAVAGSLPGEPVLIGHSMGGFLVQQYLERFSAAGAVLVAPIPPWGAARTAVDLLRRHPAAFARANLTLSMTPLVSTPARARDLFFPSAMAGAEVAGYQYRLQDESYRAFLDLVALDRVRTRRVRRVPMLVLGSEDDTLVAPAQVRRTAAIYGADVEVFPEGAHDLMLCPEWRQVAERILGWLRATLPDAG